jgi:superfamily I DNA/RNA helicase
MTLLAVEGVAGSGKTFRLMEILSQTLVDTPLAEGQRVLALTFMHGARRRLNQKLIRVTGLRGRFECMTIDSFAWRLMRRWRGLVAAIGVSPIREDQYDEQCDAAGSLLERGDVGKWIAASFSIVLIDEAQDMKPQRLRMVRALARSSITLIAADEFQCLDVALRPNPLVCWLHQSCKPQVLSHVRRTSVGALLTAAAEIRRGAPPLLVKGFRSCRSKACRWRPLFWRTQSPGILRTTSQLSHLP